MVSEVTRQFALELLDYSMEYNTKLLILFIMFVYSWFMYDYSLKIAPYSGAKDDVALKDKLAAIFMRVFSLPYMIMFPLLITFMMFRGYSLMSLLGLVTGFYIVVGVCVMIYVFLFGWDKLLEMFGFGGIGQRNKNEFKRRMRGRRR